MTLIQTQTYDIANGVFEEVKELKFLRDSMLIKEVRATIRDETSQVINGSDWLPRSFLQMSHNRLKQIQRIVCPNDVMRVHR